jgi:hypothetical protein
MESDSLSLPNFSTQDYTPLSAVSQLPLHVPLLHELLARILDQPTQPVPAGVDDPLIFDMMEDLSTTNINVE